MVRRSPHWQLSQVHRTAGRCFHAGLEHLDPAGKPASLVGRGRLALTGPAWRRTATLRGEIMTPVHLHLLLNHAPVLGAVFGLLILLGGIAWRRADVTRTAMAMFVVAGLAAVPTYLSGEPAEDAVERAAGSVESWVEPHEEAALVSLILVEALGVLALGTLWVHRRKPAVPQPLVVATALLAVVTAGSLGWTANLGGQIRHTEIRDGGPVVMPQGEDHR
jgi:hypothetical protein